MMENTAKTDEKDIRRFQASLSAVIVVVLVLLLAGVIGGEILLPKEGETGVLSGTNTQTLDGQWTQIFKDGSTATAEVPSKLPSEDGQVTVTTKLPNITESNYFLCFRCSQEDARVYVGDELRLVYSTEDSRPFGTNSVSRYVFTPLYPADSGADVRLELTSPSPLWAGTVNEVFIGDGFNIWYMLITENAMTDLAAIIVFFLGLIAILVALVLMHAYKRKGSLGYLGIFIICSGLLTFFESHIRQLYFPNLSATNYVTGVVLFLLVLSPMLFLNRCQKGRYLKAYKLLATVILIAMAVCIVLQVASIVDIITIFPELLALALLTTILLLAFVIRDFIKGLARTYQVEAISYAILVVSFMGEMFLLYVLGSRDQQGVFVCLASVIALVLMMIAEVKAIVAHETLHEVTERENAQRMILQTVSALANAVDAKDAYTNGHSTRVAQYAQEIARRSGKDAAYQQSIHAIGLLHDVGKIGIPSAIINKPDRLTEEEYEVIKTHSEKGFAVLEGITEAPELAIGARSHHERYDGTGYPDGLAGDAIPEKARILAVADLYDAMSSNRSYRSALPQATIRAEIERVSGTQLDPAFARIMLEIMEEDVDYRLREAEPEPVHEAS